MGRDPEKAGRLPEGERSAADSCDSDKWRAVRRLSSDCWRSLRRALGAG